MDRINRYCGMEHDEGPHIMHGLLLQEMVMLVRTIMSMELNHQKDGLVIQDYSNGTVMTINNNVVPKPKCQRNLGKPNI